MFRLGPDENPFTAQPTYRPSRAVYVHARSFDNHVGFYNWWNRYEARNWMIMARHQRKHGTVEYWRCAIRMGKTFSCQARLRVIFAYDDRFVIVHTSNVHPHNHVPLNRPADVNVVHQAVPMEPYPVQTAKTINVPPSTSSAGQRH